MDSPINVSVDLIDPNPYQPRQQEDPAKVQEIADSIERNGLLQVPTARALPNNRYQLAFGHTRLAAFQQLGLPDMPLMIRELSDLQMFELAVAENIKRRDLNPIEQAQAMRRYGEEFHKDSVATGAFFGVSPETVRGTVRLLHLPASLQAGVADGTLTQSAARRLLTLQRVAPQAMKDIAQDVKHAADPDEVIAETLRDAAQSVEMWPSWRHDDEPMAGSYLWPLRLPAEKFPSASLPVLSVTQAVHILGIKLETHQDGVVLQNRIDALSNGATPAAYADTAANMDDIERLAHLVKPPACTACPFYAKVKGGHFCTFKPCYERKVKAWRAHALEKAVKKLGIAAYDHKTDGAFVVLTSYHKAHQKLVESAHADLRLKKGSTYSGFEGVPAEMVIVAVGKTAEKLKAADRSREGNNEDYYAQQRRLSAIRGVQQGHLNAFLWNVITPAFQGVLADVSNLAFLERLCERFATGLPHAAEEPPKKASKAVQMEFYRRVICFELLEQTLSIENDLWRIAEKKHPVSLMAKHVQKLAASWGVKLPRNFLDLASQADQAIQLPAEEAEVK